MLKFWRRNEFIFSFFNAKKRYDKCLEVLHNFTREIVEKRRETILNDAGAGEVNILDDDVGTKPKQALLDVLLKSTINGKPLTNEEIAEEVDTFMFEGHDTVTSAITFGLYLLSQNHDAQQKIYNEIMMILGDDLNVYPTYSQLQEMKYIELCIKEMLRMYPPVPMFGKCLDEDLDLDGKILSAGCNLNMQIFALNMNPKYFPEPEKFNPERFIEGNEKSENPFVYVPFSAGPRNCIGEKKKLFNLHKVYFIRHSGQKFAMLELKSTFCNIVRNFELLPGNIEPILLMQLTLKSSNGIHVGFRRRERS